MGLIRRFLRWNFEQLERILGWVFPAHWNPLLNLGALGFFFYWIVTATGIYTYIFFDTTVRGAYASVEYMTHDQWYAAGVMRSLHRYASDGLVAVMLLHLLREFSLDRYRGVRWFSWITGIPVLVMVYLAGISGYWLVWDKLAQYVAVVSTEWLDKPGVFGESIARNFLHPGMVEDRFFTLMIFLHIAIPLIALVVMWMHLQRVTKPRINPPRGLAYGVLVSMTVLSLVHPALSQGPANLTEAPPDVGLDWFYLGLYPLLDHWPGTATWTAAAAFLVITIALPWLPPLRAVRTAVVDLPNCNGCIRCFNDCPYNAITMVPRTDGEPFERQPAVNASLCTGCGICAGACPTAMPFRRASELVAGIDLPDFTIADLRARVHEVGAALEGRARVLMFGCEPGAPLASIASSSVGVVGVRCVGQVPPSLIDYVLSKNLADGVMLAGCSESNCFYRFGAKWTGERIARTRDPQLRARVPPERIAVSWAGATGSSRVAHDVETFAVALARFDPQQPQQTMPGGSQGKEPAHA